MYASDVFSFMIHQIRQHDIESRFFVIEKVAYGNIAS
jgi:hypothetical protein